MQYRVRLTKREQLTPRILHLHFSLEEPARMEFLPGQFVGVVVPDGGKRCYSLCNLHPGEEGIELCADIAPDGPASRYLDGLAQGDGVTLEGPYGRFVVARNTGLSKIFLATGVGIAPFRAMLSHLLAHERERVHLLFGVRATEDAFWLDEFSAFAREYSHFSFELVLSRPPGDWQGLSGHVTHHLEAALTELGACHIYLCGSVEMVREARARCRALGVPDDRIHFEVFYSVARHDTSTSPHAVV
jgi:CDP-4-dehydro-6-deoxyglucose reductase